MSILMRECAMRCSARRVVLMVVLVVAVRLLWLSFFSGPRTSLHPQASDVLENRGSTQYKQSTGLIPTDDASDPIMQPML